jgi:hypothetical protein
VSWGEEIAIVAEHPSTAVKDRSLEFWVTRWRARESDFTPKMQILSMSQELGSLPPKLFRKAHANSLNRCRKNKRSTRGMVV